MSRLFLKKLIVILTAVTVQGLVLNVSSLVLAQEDAAAEVEAQLEAALVEAEELEDDDDDAPDVGGMVANWGTTKAKIFGAKKFLLKQAFEVEVEQAIEICELDERQLKKLKIASRGAAKKAYEKWKTKGLQQMGIGNFGNANADDDADEEEITPEVYTDADDIDAQTLQIADGMMFNPFQREIPTESKFWKKALKASLGDEQNQKLMKHRAQQDLLKREKAAEAAVEAFAFELRLSDKKKQAFKELVMPKMLECETSIGPMYEQFVLYYYASKASKSKLKKILSKAQLQKWKSAIGPAKQIGQMIEMQNGQNNDEDEVRGGDWEETMSFLVELDNAVDDVVEGVTDFVEGVFGK